ncbi:hypothetical protein L3Q72_11140 [Vibrio sp. JC009]|uniref:hypothetical protein n=1 Tax=Vibrio sp. JC009 TaxID=2912314 RepID=UPI0023B1C03D|nr:hypothetical protein [Vibrio sp. JC009]WED21191.1 hypothetical protein L3Q72_11140 [Vibrio sp. JC009]
MDTKDVSAEIERVLQELSNQNKQPTVALVKARLSSPVPMPAIIAAIKSWKGSNRVPKIEVAAKTEGAAEERIARLETLVAELSARIEKLEKEQ